MFSTERVEDPRSEKGFAYNVVPSRTHAAIRARLVAKGLDPDGPVIKKPMRPVTETEMRAEPAPPEAPRLGPPAGSGEALAAGKEAHRRGDYEAAAAALKDYVARAPDDFDAFKYYLDALFRLGRRDELATAAAAVAAAPGFDAWAHDNAEWGAFIRESVLA
jgi:hypothetical protein